MSGRVDFNFPTFARAATFLRSRGHEIVNPAAKEAIASDESVPDWRKIPKAWSCPTGAGLSETETPGLILRWDVEQILTCDGVVFLPGWRESVGARFEALLAQMIETPRYEIDAKQNGGLLPLFDKSDNYSVAPFIDVVTEVRDV